MLTPRCHSLQLRINHLLLFALLSSQHLETNVLEIGGRIELRLRIETLVKPAHNAMRDLLIQAANELYNRPWHDPMGFYQIAGMHAAPFAPYDSVVNPKLGLWTGGYCNHGNVLFGTW